MKMAVDELPARRDSSKDSVCTASTTSSHNSEATATSQTASSENCQGLPATPSKLTVLFLDWDDTLFPTSHIEQHCPALWQVLCDGSSDACAEHTAILEESMQATAALLRLAASMTHVCVVTMGCTGWVETCCRIVMPELLSLLVQLDIRVIYARGTMPAGYIRVASKDGLSISQQCKQRAMTRALRKLNKRTNAGARASLCWHSVLSIGDSEAERLALQDVLLDDETLDRRGAFSDCACKTVKLLDSPCLEMLLAELQIMVSWLGRLVCQDGTIDISFDDLANGDQDLSSRTWAQVGSISSAFGQFC
jgi:hypothetical protein